jgi:homoserine kinase
LSTFNPLAIPAGASVTARAPGGIGNMGPGIDILGCAVTGRYDRVRVTRRAAKGIHIEEPGHPDLPTEPQRHAAAIAADEVLRRAGATAVGLSIHVSKELPIAGGQGGSSASAVAAALATNLLLGDPLSRNELLLASLEAEGRVAGRHLDNVAPALLGGIQLVLSVDPLHIVRIPAPSNLRVVLAHPNQRLRTADARAVLPRTIDRGTAMAQAASIAAMVAAFATGDLVLLRAAVNDRIAEPARTPLLPGFAEAKRAALAVGALGCSISGAGPTAFAFASTDEEAATIADAMCDAYASCGVEATSRIARIDEDGARVVEATGDVVR